MLKQKVYLSALLFLLITLSGCSSPEKPLDDEYVAETDFPYMLQGSSKGTRIASSSNGYYFLNSNYIYYMDHKGNKPVILDSRPDNGCLNEKGDSNCNAYVPLRVDTQSILLQFYKGYLYTIEYQDNGWGKPGTHYLVRRDPDGSNRKVLRTFSNALVKEAAIHRNYIFYSVMDNDKESNLTYEILQLPLNDLSQKPKVLYKKENEDLGRSIAKMIPYGSQIYLTEMTEERYRVRRYDLNKASVSTIWERSDGGFASIQAIQDKKVYFSYYYPRPDGDPSELFDKRSLKFYSSNLDGSEIQETDLPSASILPNLYLDNRFTYVRPMWAQVTRVKDTVIDEMNMYKDGKLMHTVDMSMFPLAQSLTAGDERYMFIQFEKDNQSYIYYLDKNEIESGTAKFTPLIETPINLNQ